MKKKTVRADGYMSAMLGGRQITSITQRLLPTMVADAYMTRGIASAIVDRPAEDTMSRGVEIENDNENTILDEFERLNVLGVLTKALKMALLCGASAILPIMDDSPDLADPIDPNHLGQLRFLRPIHGDWIKATEDIDMDSGSENFGQPLLFYVNFPGSGVQQRIHYSRLIKIPGEGEGMDAIRQNPPWRGRSTIASCWVELQDFFDAMRWSILILERKQSPVYKMKGLAELIGAGVEGEIIAQRRVSNVDTVRNTLRSVVVDSEDEYTVNDLTLSGIKDVIGEAKVALAASARIPASILFGESITGLNSSGEGEMSIYHSRVSQIQANSVLAAMVKVVELICSQKGTWPPDWKIKFMPLWEPSEKEEAETEKLEAETRGVELASIAEALAINQISPEEAREMIVAIFPEANLTGPLPEQPEPVIDPLLVIPPAVPKPVVANA